MSFCEVIFFLVEGEKRLPNMEFNTKSREKTAIIELLTRLFVVLTATSFSNLNLALKHRSNVSLSEKILFYFSFILIKFEES